MAHFKRFEAGGILSAYLFTFYIDEILKVVSDMPYSCKLGINKINVQAYADDIVVLSPTSTGLQKILQKLHDLLSQHELLINVEKTKVMCFKRGRILSENNAKFFIGESPIKQELRYNTLDQ